MHAGLCPLTAALLPRLDEIFELLLSQLRHGDSYLFLAAVAGCAALADAYAEVR